MSITPQQCRAARAFVEMEQEELAGKANVPLNDIVEFEADSRTPPANNLATIRKALESAGVIFIDEDDAGGPGVRLHKTHVQKRQREWSPKGRNGTPTGVRVSSRPARRRE